MEQLEIWHNGLCREFSKAVGEIIRINQISNEEYDLECIGQEVVKLHQEIFDCTEG